MGKAKTKPEGGLRERFRALLRTHPSFSFATDDGKTWLCPYCGVPAVKDRKAPNFEGLALKHVLTKCPKANALQGQPMTEAQLKDVAEFLRMRKRYLSEPAWRVRVGGGGWLCPHCVQQTEVKLLAEKGAQRPVDDVVRDIRRHLSHCYSYWQSPTTWHSVEEIRSAVGERKKQDAIADRMAEAMQSNPVFQFKDKDGHWICPFCEKPVDGVDFSTPFARTHSAPRQAVAHLQSSACSHEGDELDPGKTAEDMQQIAERGRGVPAAPEEEGATQHIATLRSELHELRSQMEDSKDLQRDLERARKAQQRMLPAAPPDLAGYDLSTHFLACEKVSGDFYDFVPLSDGRVGIVVGDVSGHGIDAGIVMGMAKKAFRLRAQSGDDPAAVAAKVNEDIFPDLEATMFVTAIYGVLCPAEHTFRFVRCGHTFPVHYGAGSAESQEIRTEGMALGALSGPVATQGMQQAKVRMEPGDVIALFTDGLIEAATNEDEEFGSERMKGAVLRHGGSSAQCVVEGIMGAIHVFKYGSPQADDYTLVVIRRQP